jgi:P4 family phage/plasmid primase-like protien
MSSEADHEAWGREFDALHAKALAGGEQKKSGAEIAIGFIGHLFTHVSEQPIYFSSLPNDKNQAGQPPERHVMTRETAVVTQFMRRWDRAARALYFCVATLQPDAKRRAKETIAEIVLLHADIDFKSVDLRPDEIKRKLGELRLLPTIMVGSGHGLHAYWLLQEAILATPEAIEQVEAVLRLLCDHVGGDRQVCEVSRLMRLPGSHNSKDGDWLEVEILIERPNMRYGLDELEEWLAEVSPIIRRKDDAPVEQNPWLAVAAQFSIKPPIDVEQRLAAMRYQGGGDSGIHGTQVSVTAALLVRGHPLEEIVASVLAATRVAAGNHGERWNWAREERAVRKMCADWLAKHPELGQREQAKAATEDTAQATGTDDAAVISLAQERKERSNRQQKSKAGKTKTAGSNAVPIAIIEGVLDIVRNSGGNLLLNAGDLHVYKDGVWRVATGGDEQGLRCLIQQGCEALGEGAKLGVVNAAWKRLVEHPDLYRENVEWDRRNLIAVANGVLDLRTQRFSEWSADHYLRRKLGVAYDPTRICSQFLELMASFFADRDAATRADNVALLQEFFGACLGIGLLNREHRRALMLKGPSRTGKTELAGIIRLLVGEPVAAPSVCEIGERFGAETFYGACAWIRDDAVNEGDRINPERFKTIVTGEAIDIERKNRKPVRQVRLEIPVILTANSLPTSRDSSDAIFNRCLVVDMMNVISEEAAVATRRRHNITPGITIGAWIFEKEGPGILNWALDGLGKLLARGQFNIPTQVRDAIQSFKDECNPVAEWARSMLVPVNDSKIERADLLCAFHGWWREEMGDDVRLLGGRWLMPKLRAACPWITSTNTMGTRYFIGIKLNDGGLAFWERQSSDAAQRGHGSRGTAASKAEVNKTYHPPPLV